jgi:general secretion pathway protein C
MQTRPFPPLSSIGWPAWLGTLAAFAVLCAVVAWWAVQLLAPRAPVAPAAAAGETQALPELRLAAQLFGAAPGAQGAATATATAGNVTVVGVLAAGMRGSAILSVDGQPPRAYAVGERIGPSQTLFEVRGDQVVIEQGGRRLALAAPTRPALSLLTDGPRRAGGIDPGFSNPARADAPRIARPLGAGSSTAAGAPPLPVRPAPVQGALPVLPPAPSPAALPSLPGGTPSPALPGGATGGIVPVVPEAQATDSGQRGD